MSMNIRQEKNDSGIGDANQIKKKETITLISAVIVIVSWSIISILLIEGFDVWFSSVHYVAHLALNVTCISMSAIYAGRLRGPLDYKIGQALAAVIVIFGAFALILIVSRFFYSRSLLVGSVTGAAIVSSMVVVLHHKLASRHVAIVEPLMGAVPVPSSFGTKVLHPETDLRGFDIVLISLAEPVSADWARSLSRAMLAGCSVRHIGEYFEESNGSVSLEHFEIDHLPPNGIASYKALKRALDIALVIFIAPVAVPIFFAAALLILVTMGRPIFFLQRRMGLGGQPFTMYKLRSMRPEKDGEIVKAAVVGDERVTKVGRVIRRFRIDELPQLWNVVKGDMSLIGPRPEAVSLHAQYVEKLPNYSYRYLVRPGITGWAQVSTSPSANADEARRKLTYDLFYVKRLSLYLDLQIVVRTFWTIASGGGVR